MVSLPERQKAYEDAVDTRIIQRLPIIIRIDGRNFHKVTRKLRRPYCPLMLDLMGKSMVDCIREIDGAVFGYQQSDEITFVLRNDWSFDSDAWFGNRVQKIVSVVASLITYNFNKNLIEMEDKPNIIGPCLFDARVFPVPNIVEAVNNLVWRQQDCMRNAVTNAAYSELGKKYGRKTAANMLHGKTTIEREAMLFDKCNVVFAEEYEKAYRHGLSTYKAPRVVKTDHGQVTRHKWILDRNTPIFNENKDFIFGILDSGQDIFRAKRDLAE